MSVRQLAEACAQVGVPELTQASLSNIERGQDEAAKRKPREVTVSELFALAQALDVAPVHLLVPADAPADDAYQVTPATSATVWDVRAWVRGFQELPGSDQRRFYTAVPEVEFGARKDHPERYRWVWGVVRYLSRSMGGRRYVRDDGRRLYEIELPGKDGDEQ